MRSRDYVGTDASASDKFQVPSFYTLIASLLVFVDTVNDSVQIVRKEKEKKKKINEIKIYFLRYGICTCTCICICIAIASHPARVLRYRRIHTPVYVV
jgi:hypothetical protein